MLATIVTYELVLLQFDSEPDEQIDGILNTNECSLELFFKPSLEYDWNYCCKNIVKVEIFFHLIFLIKL